MLQKTDPPSGGSAFQFDVFVSYSHKDSKWVMGELVPRLRQAGLNVHVDDEGFRAGKLAIDEMEHAVRASRKIILVLTPEYFGSDWCVLELKMAQTLDPANKAHRLVPVMLKPCEPGLSLSIFSHQDFTKKDRWKELMLAVRPAETREDRALGGSLLRRARLRPTCEKDTPTILKETGRKIAEGLLRRPGVEEREDFQLLTRQGIVDAAAIASSLKQVFIDQPIVLLGGPAAGKTIVLARVLARLLENPEETEVMPIYLSLGVLRSFTPQTDTGCGTSEQFEQWLLDAVCSTYLLADKTEVNDIIKSGRAVLLLDALDELNPDEAVRSGVMDYLCDLAKQQTGILVSCRTACFPAAARKQCQVHVIDAVAGADKILRAHGLDRLAELAGDDETSSEGRLLRVALYLSIVILLIQKKQSTEEELLELLSRDEGVEEKLMGQFCRALVRGLEMDRQDDRTQARLPAGMIERGCVKLASALYRIRHQNRPAEGAAFESSGAFAMDDMQPAVWCQKPRQRLRYVTLVGAFYGLCLGFVTVYASTLAVVAGAVFHPQGRFSLDVLLAILKAGGLTFSSVCLSFFIFQLVRQRILLGVCLGLAFSISRATVLASVPFFASGKTWMDRFLEMAPPTCLAIGAIFWWWHFDLFKINVTTRRELKDRGGFLLAGVYCLLGCGAVVLLFGLLGNLPGGLSIGLSLSGAMWWFFSLRRRNEAVTAEENQRIILALQRSVIMASVTTVFAMVCEGVIWNRYGEPGDGPINGALASAFMLSVLAYGGTPVLQHYALRLTLASDGTLPLNLSRVLREAGNCGLMKRVGLAYQFFHPSALTWFARQRR